MRFQFGTFRRREHRIGQVNRDVDVPADFIEQIAKGEQIISSRADDGERVQIVPDNVRENPLQQLGAYDFLLRQ